MNSKLCDLGLWYDCVGKCKGFREEQPERKNLREGMGVNYARKIYHDELGVAVGDGSHLLPASLVSGSGRSCIK